MKNRSIAFTLMMSIVLSSFTPALNAQFWKTGPGFQAAKKWAKGQKLNEQEQAAFNRLKKRVGIAALLTALAAVVGGAAYKASAQKPAQQVARLLEDRFYMLYWDDSGQLQITHLNNALSKTDDFRIFTPFPPTGIAEFLDVDNSAAIFVAFDDGVFQIDFTNLGLVLRVDLSHDDGVHRLDFHTHSHDGAGHSFEDWP